LEQTAIFQSALNPISSGLSRKSNGHRLYQKYFSIRCGVVHGEGQLMKIVPLDLRTANAYVAQRHRHNGPTNGHKFSVGAIKNETLVGVCICGKPIARRLDDGKTLEVRRVCTDGTRNACSLLYGAAARIAKEMGYSRIITYTLQSEPGTSLKASGWVCEGKAGGTSWDMPGRSRDVFTTNLFETRRKYPSEGKTRWEKVLIFLAAEKHKQRR
jgi:hypothetical protein